MSYLHLSRLKARLLPPETAASTRYDARLSPIAAGVATMFDRHLGRSLLRGTVTERFPGGWETYSLDRYPVETVTAATVHLREEGGTRELTVARLNQRAGLVHFTTPAGTSLDELRVTYAGGYWADTSEAGDGTLPTGATALPADLIDAWVLQIDHECRTRKIFGGTSAEDLAAPISADFDILPRVAKTLRQYLRL